MNKNIKNWLLVGATVTFMTACDSRLDVKPTQSIEESTALATSQDVEVTLIGAYDGLSSINLYGGAVQYSGDLLGDDAEVRFAGTFSTLDELWRKTMTTTNGQTQSTWLQAYNTINRANNVLATLDKLEASKKAKVEGEARFIRGLVYFDLVRLWAKAWGDGDNNTNLGVPLVTTPTRVVGETDNRPRATVAAVYAQVLEDLTKAESLLGNISDAGFASKNAVQAILARVYLQQGNYAAARDAANRVISSGQFALAPSFPEAFDDATNDGEMIFKVIVTDQDGGNDLNTFYAPSTYQGRGDIRIQAKHLALYSAGDTRGTFFVRASNNNFTAKFLDQYGDVPVVRLAEMYLIRAEANQRLGTSVGATPLADINLIRARAGARTLTTVDLNAILTERKLELAFEGQQVHDAKRLKRNVGTLAFSDNKLVIPIPQREIDTNKALVQNPGY
ncbi:RagB/SusD domain-containing protein [Emticicia oligotrophica DSM 17448]|uniref:RagB/SusD domain-containing protein n=1 Tax=Emticicia oligotrophica (strain DSM 17448 / CIP 109782 / MTCC 6937 / GPTSA100-15) TaxID=929562 RepID=A0ABN4AC03_EMTOG|nr:RagB/SusD family nutrient uptake outer membrane protein [Emticicia oligotrophica]AFK01735.1 RagB/SusD domain-containing protein [Emticicia oligotrophica DSM 17448]